MEQVYRVLIFANDVWHKRVEPGEISSIFTKNWMYEMYLWPDADQVKKTSNCYKFLHFLTNCSHIFLTITMLANLIFQLRSDDWDLVHFLEDCCITNGAIMVTSKASFFIWKRTDITDLIKRVNIKNFHLRDRAEANTEIRKLRRFYYLLEMFVTIPFLFNSILLVILLMFQPFFSKTPGLPCPAKFPFDTTPFNKGFYAAYVYEIINLFLMVTMYAMTDMTIGNCFNQIVLYFHVLNLELQSLGYKEMDLVKSNPSRFQTLIKKRLIEVVVEYQNLYELVKFCNRFLKLFFVFLIGIITSNYCLIIYSSTLAIKNSFVVFMKFVVYFAYMVTIFLYWCWLGNRVSIQSTELANSAYFSNWIEGDQDFKKLLLFFMHRAQKPIEFHAKPFYAFNLQTFGSVMSKAYSVFTVLKKL